MRVHYYVFLSDESLLIKTEKDYNQSVSNVLTLNVCSIHDHTAPAF